LQAYRDGESARTTQVLLFTCDQHFEVQICILLHIRDNCFDKTTNF